MKSLNAIPNIFQIIITEPITRTFSVFCGNRGIKRRQKKKEITKFQCFFK